VKTIVYDYSGGQFPLTAKFLAGYFGATIVPATPTSPAPARGQQTFGLVVVLGHDFALRFLGL
jgi:predicted acyltransferase